MKRAVFLDRDGTIIEDTYYLHDPEKIIVLPYAVKALKKLQNFGFSLVIISNQSGIGRGYFKEKTLTTVNKRLLSMLKHSGINIDGIYYSPYYKESKIAKYRKGVNFRKPNPGMLLQAAKDLNIELTASYIVGDKESDIGAGVNAGLKSNILIKGKYKYEKKEFVPDKIAENLDKATDWIIGQETQSRIITNKKKLKEIVQQLKKSEKRIVTTNGVFDILHIGHIRYLKECKKYGDILVIGLNSDQSAKINKGKTRPVINQFARAEMLINLKPVDYVYIFNEKDPREFLKIVKTDVHIKAADYTMNQIIEKRTVEKNEGKVILAKVIKGYSTTDIIKKIATIQEDDNICEICHCEER